MRGKFIAFEGLDGSGKSIQLDLLKEWLIEQEVPVITGGEPTDSPIGKLTREVSKGLCSQRTLGPLITADRVEHVFGNGGILETLQKGTWYLSSRYTWSTIVLNQDFGILYAKNLQSIFDDVQPDLWIYLDLPPDIAYKRILKSGKPLERLETETLLEGNYRDYFMILSRLPEDNVLKVNMFEGTTIEEVHEVIIKRVKEMI